MANLPPALQPLTQPAQRTFGAYLLLAYLAFMSLGLWAVVGWVVYLNR